MSVANPLWGAPRIHGELLKLGIDVGQITVSKYMARRRQPPSQGWKFFLRNHADGIVSMDLFVVPTISFRLLYGFLILQHSRRELLWLGVTARPSAHWIARQLTEAYGWQQTPRYIVRFGLSGFASNPTRGKLGTVIVSNSSCFEVASSWELDRPVVLPPGRARLATKPLPTGSTE